MTVAGRDLGRSESVLNGAPDRRVEGRTDRHSVKLAMTGADDPAPTLATVRKISTGVCGDRYDGIGSLTL